LPDHTHISRRVAVGFLVLATVMASAAIWFGSRSANTVSTTDPTLVSEGSVIYAQHCQICHGAAGQGGTGPALAGDLAERYPDVAAQKLVILTGPKSMPSFATRLTDHEIDAVVAFTRTGL